MPGKTRKDKKVSKRKVTKGAKKSSPGSPKRRQTLFALLKKAFGTSPKKARSPKKQRKQRSVKSSRRHTCA